MIRFFSSLRFRLLLLVLLAVVPALGLVIYTASEQRRLTGIQAQEDALRIARVAASNQEQLIETTHQSLIVLAQIPSIRDRDQPACHSFLADLLKRYPQYLQFGVADLNGDVVCTAIPDTKPINIAANSLLRRVIETRDFAVGEYLIGFISGKSAVGFGYPLFDGAGTLQGLVFASLDLGYANQLAAQALLPPGSILALRDRNGTILARYPNPEIWVGQSVPDAPLAKIIANRDGEGLAESIGVDNVQRLYAFAPLRTAPKKDLYVSVGIPTAVAFAPVNQVLIHNLIGLGLVTLLALTAAWVGGDYFLVRRVNALRQVIQRLVAGDFSARTGLRYGSGELGELACAFDQMALVLEQRETERQHVEQRVRRWSAQLEGLINAVVEALTKPLEVSRMANIVLDKTIRAMDLSAGCMFLKRGDEFELVAQSGLGAQTLQRINPGAVAAREIAALVRADVVQPITDPIWVDAFAPAKQVCSWIAVPLASKGNALGVMCLAAQDARTLELHEQRVLAAVGQQIGIAIENAELYDQVQSIAALKERERISRELHDGLAQVLGYLCIRNKVATELITNGEIENARAQLQEMQGAMQETYQDVREAILGLRTTVSPNRGMVSALKEFAHKFSQQNGIRVNLIANEDGHGECAPEVEVQLLRIIQEALSNVRKHSKAKQASVKFERQQTCAVVTIEDDGIGFDATTIARDGQSHFGLQTMKERAEGVGGSFEILSQPGQGTRVVVTVSCEQRKK